MPSFFVAGKCAPQPRPLVRRFGPKCGKCYMPKLVSTISTPRQHPAFEWKEHVATVAKAADLQMFVGPVKMDLLFVLEPPRSLLKTKGGFRKGARTQPTGSKDGDADNLAKAVMDALEGIIYPNDTAVVQLGIMKRWAEPGETPGVHVGYSNYD